MNDILITISINPFYLGGISILSIFVGFYLAKFLNRKPKQIVDIDITDKIIDDYIEENITPEMDVSNVIPKHVKSNIPVTDEPPRILIAEDNLVNAKILIKIIRKYGIEHYVHVMDGQYALEARMDNDKFDIILMDINMPRMTGDEATQEIIKWENQNNKIHIPIIAVTANALKGDREKYISLGMDDYTTKPVKYDVISEILFKYTGYKGEN
jgi:CheY-like chemotaxis protein